MTVNSIDASTTPANICNFSFCGRQPLRGRSSIAHSIPSEADSALICESGRGDDAVQVCCPVPGTLERGAPPADHDAETPTVSGLRLSASRAFARSAAHGRSTGDNTGDNTGEGDNTEIVQETVQGTAGDER